MILTLQTQFIDGIDYINTYSDDIGSTHSIVMIFTLYTQYSDGIDSTNTVL